MSIFGKIRNTYRLQQDAKRIKKELKNIHIEAEEEGVLTVTVNAEQELLTIRFTDKTFQEITTGALTKEKLADICVKTLNRAFKKAQEIAASKMKGIWEMMGGVK